MHRIMKRALPVQPVMGISPRPRLRSARCTTTWVPALLVIDKSMRRRIAPHATSNTTYRVEAAAEGDATLADGSPRFFQDRFDGFRGGGHQCLRQKRRRPHTAAGSEPGNG